MQCLDLHCTTFVYIYMYTVHAKFEQVYVQEDIKFLSHPSSVCCVLESILKSYCGVITRTPQLSESPEPMHVEAGAQ